MEERYIALDGKVYEANEIDRAAKMVEIQARIDAIQIDRANTVATFDAQIAVLNAKLDELRAL